MPAAVQTAAVTAWQSADLSTNPSLTTVDATLVLSTQYGVRSDAGCVEPGVRGVLLLEDGLALGVVPTWCYLVTDEGGAVGALAHRLLRHGVAPDDRVVALGEVDRVRVGVLAAVEREDLRVRDVPCAKAVLEALSDELADLHVVAADVVGVGTGKGRSVVADELDALRLRESLDLVTDCAVERGHDQG